MNKRHYEHTLPNIRGSLSNTYKPRTGKWIKRMALAAAAFIMFSYLYSRGISPVWAAVAIVCFRGFFRFLYKIACLLVAAAILFCILSCLVF
jgi:site-specific recombinase XerD